MNSVHWSISIPLAFRISTIVDNIQVHLNGDTSTLFILCTSNPKRSQLHKWPYIPWKTAWVPNDFRGHPGPGFLQQPLHFLRRLGIIKRLCCRDGSLTTAAAISAGKLSLNGDRDSTLTWWQVWKKHPESLISLGLWSSFLQCPCGWHASRRHLLTLIFFRLVLPPARLSRLWSLSGGFLSHGDTPSHHPL